ncbi:MAG: CPXCG motif-containing cysteine-rich protein [Planctomicrobium sp.]|nr:CPXCG motif-containing cysteine-rich protein [Planctomicrobium sp.]
MDVKPVLQGRVPAYGTQGRSQEYVEDCPVCCCPMVIQIEVSPDGEVSCRAHRE